MMEPVFAAEPMRLLIAAAAGVALLLLLIGLGSLFGGILEVSGGAQCVAQTLVNKFGEKKAGIALGITGLVVGTTVFFEAGVVILIPLAFGLAKKTKKSTLYYVIPLLAGLATGFAFIPPSAGSVLVANMLNVDLGIMIAVGVPVGIVSLIFAGILWSKFIGNRINTGLPSNIQEVRETEEGKLQSFSTVLWIILVPLILILCSTVSEYIPGIDSVRPVLQFLGTPFVALILASVGAAVIAMTMAAGIMAAMPEAAELSPVYLAAMVCAINGGATAFSYVNDSGFWLVNSLLEIDEKTTLKSWTMMETIIGFTGLICAILISFWA